MNFLITSGGTREPIDGVRFITNFSSGNTGAFLTDYFRNHGHHVTLLHGKESKLPASQGEAFEFQTFNDLEQLLRKKLSEFQYDVVIHLAAISDYSVNSVEVNGTTFTPDLNQKISSETETITLHLKRNSKLINQLKELSHQSRFILIGFKLTNTKSAPERLSAIQKMALNQDIDFIVHNDLSQVEKDGKHIANIYKNLLSPLHSKKSNAHDSNSKSRGENLGPSLHFAAQAQTKIELAKALDRLLKESL